MQKLRQTFFINGIELSVTVFVAVLFIVAGSYFATYSKKFPLKAKDGKKGDGGNGEDR